MSQQYILLRKENDSLNSLIGQSFNQKAKFEAYKILTDIHKKVDQHSMAKSLVYVTDKNEILHLGGSTLMKDKNGKIVSDLILDQFGKWLAAIFKTAALGQITTTMNDITGSSQTVAQYGTTPPLFNNDGTNFGVSHQVGAGLTAPTRADFGIETAFGTSPESARFEPAANPVFNSGLGNFITSATITAGGTGTITESILIQRWDNTASSLTLFAMFRDSISPSVAFGVGQSITVEYTVSL